MASPNGRRSPAHIWDEFLPIIRIKPLLPLGEGGVEGKLLEGKLWEMRMKGRDTIARAIYVTAIGQRIVVVRVFTKKRQKTPRREIEIALQRAKEIK